MYCHRNHHIFCDNFFTSVKLALELERCGLYMCGTMRGNRKGFPADLKKYTKKSGKVGDRGEHVTRQYGSLTVSAWQDKKVVIVISNLSDPTKQETVKRRLKDGTTITIPCPESVKSYNKHMGGIDYSDQLRKYYQVRLKSRKFYKYIFWFMVELAITNAYILCKHHSSMNIANLKEFRSQLAIALIGSYSSRKRRGRPSALPAPKRFSQMLHWPRKASTRSHRCHYCQVHFKRRRETTWRCDTCSVFLCHNGTPEDDCYFAYHLSQDC